MEADMNDEAERQLQERIRKRAYRLWQEEGQPEGQADTHWDKATELVAIEDNQSLAMEPIPQPGDLSDSGEPIEQAATMRNLGDFPTMTDQGEEQTYPSIESDANAQADLDALVGASSAPAGKGRQSASRPAAKGADKSKTAPATAQPPGGAAGGNKKPKGKTR
jgi:hypothetical protein